MIERPFGSEPNDELTIARRPEEGVLQATTRT
jgi:hypothetical protein